MKNERKGFVKGVISTVLVFATVVSVSALQATKNAEISYRDIKICIDGNYIVPTDASGNTVEPFIMNGTTYLPVRAISSAFNKSVQWNDATSTIFINSISTPTANDANDILSTPDVIESRIDGEFEGWDGDTIFVLTNGQIWQQSSYAYHYCYAYSPKVLIYKSGSGYKMYVEKAGKEISVKRLK